MILLKGIHPVQDRRVSTGPEVKKFNFKVFLSPLKQQCRISTCLFCRQICTYGWIIKVCVVFLFKLFFIVLITPDSGHACKDYPSDSQDEGRPVKPGVEASLQSVVSMIFVVHPSGPKNCSAYQPRGKDPSDYRVDLKRRVKFVRKLLPLFFSAKIYHPQGYLPLVFLSKDFLFCRGGIPYSNQLRKALLWPKFSYRFEDRRPPSRLV